MYKIDAIADQQHSDNTVKLNDGSRSDGCVDITKK
jgi:hypothetical protein